MRHVPGTSNIVAAVGSRLLLLAGLLALNAALLLKPASAAGARTCWLIPQESTCFCDRGPNNDCFSGKDCGKNYPNDCEIIID